MSKLEKLSVFFVTIETLVNMYKQNEEVKFENLVVITDQRIPICKVYYAENKIIGNPYKLEVNKSKFISWRQKVVQFIVDDMIVRYQKGQTNRTLSAYVQKVFNFIDWIDQNNIDLDDDINTAKYAFLQYTAFLKSKIRDGGYSQGEAHSRHTYAYKLLNTIYQDSENIIGAGIKIIPNKRPNKVVKSQSEDQKYHYNFLRNILEKTATFLGYGNWGELLPAESREAYCRRINLYSHSRHSGEESSIVKEEDKRVLTYLVKEVLIPQYHFHSIVDHK
mgnify:CR=1 FL=1